jgi:hypothetical protein
VRVECDVAITIEFGDVTIVAVDGQCDMPAGAIEYFGVNPSITHIAYKTT